MIVITKVRAEDIVAIVAPRALGAYRQAFGRGDALLAEAGVTTPLRLTHFLAQLLHETAGLTLLVEDGRYSAQTLGAMWDAGNWHRYFADRAACVRMADRCRIDGGVALFSLVYGGRLGNGAAATQDGWRYRGRGLLQITGRAAYAAAGARCGMDFLANPDLIATADHVLEPALSFWRERGCNAAADRDDLEAVTRLVNGGRNGLSGRKAWLTRVRSMVAPANAREFS